MEILRGYHRLVVPVVMSGRGRGRSPRRLGPQNAKMEIFPNSIFSSLIAFWGRDVIIPALDPESDFQLFCHSGSGLGSGK